MIRTVTLSNVFVSNVCMCCAVYKEDVMQLCESPESSGTGWKSVILLVPVRLGGDSLNPSYIECVKVRVAHMCCAKIVRRLI